MITAPDTVRDTLPRFLEVGVEHAAPEPGQMTFGQYDFFPTDSTGLFFNFEEGAALSMHSFPAGNAGMPLPFSPWLQSAFFLLFLLSFMLFAFIFRWEGTALKGNFKSIFSPRKPPSSVHKSQVTKTEAWGEFFLLLQTILVSSILVFSWLWDQGFSLFPAKTQLLGFTGLFLSLLLLVYLKIGCYRLVGTFFLRNEMKSWSTFYSRVMELLGIAAFLPAVFYVYLHEVRIIMLALLAALFITSRLIIYLELLNIFVKNKISPFYFFVYLCGTEIAPYLLLYKGVLFVITVV